jgi:DNA-binding transcriptional regulator YiaG
MLPKHFIEKFSRLSDNECWPWLACTCQGYGHIRHEGKIQKAHRLMYIDAKGPIPEGQIVMHTCDNRRCINPNHLVAGTVKDNNIDRDKKGRQISKRGELHGMSKLKTAQAAEIVAFRDEIALKVDEFSERFAVSKTTVRDVLSGRIWRWYKT